MAGNLPATRAAQGTVKGFWEITRIPSVHLNPPECKGHVDSQYKLAH